MVVEYQCRGCPVRPGHCLGLWESTEAFSFVADGKHYTTYVHLSQGDYAQFSAPQRYFRNVVLPLCT